MKVIQANKTHLKEIVPLFDQYRQFYEKSSDLDGARNFLKARFNNNESTIFIALDTNERVLGFTQLYPQFSSVSMKPDYLLNDLFVAQEARGNGIGKALLLRAQDFAKSNNAKGIMLETAVDNPAQHLYEKMGFVNDKEVYYYGWLTPSE